MTPVELEEMPDWAEVPATHVCPACRTIDTRVVPISCARTTLPQT